MKTAPSFDKLVDELSRLPGVGPRTAARLAFFIVKQPQAWVETLAKALLEVKHKIRFCSICGQTTEEDPCAICADPRRDSRLICVVEEPQDVMMIERTHAYHGLYHVLHGAISPLDGIGPEQLRIESLMKRLEDGTVQEVVLATNFTTKGETTALYLARLLHEKNIRVTRPAHGIPLGGNLEYVDENTVGKAVVARQSF